MDRVTLRRKRVSRVFDNDATLWCEKPMYLQPDFIIHRLAEKATADASLAGQQPYKTASSGDQNWSAGAITKHCQGDDTDFKTLVAALLTAHEAITVDEHAWPGKRALRHSAASDAGPSGT